jgi:tRNA 2-thiouridine synthesizing protein A
VSPAGPAPDATEDALGLLCPLPILRARAALRRLRPGAVLELLSDDEAILRDLPAFCAGEGHALVALEEIPLPASGRRTFRALVRRGGDAARG